jgi:hypothetical protein
MPWSDSSSNSNDVSYWSNNSADSSNNPYRFDHLHIPQGNTSGINDGNISDDNELAEDLDNDAMEDTVLAKANPSPVHVIIEANQRTDLLARLTVKYVFLICLQGFTTIQRTILEHHLRRLDLLASHQPTQSTKAWWAAEVQAAINKEEIWHDYSYLMSMTAIRNTYS